MIFSIGDHIEQIKAGTKTQTRRSSSRYKVGKFYTVQPCRTCKGIPDGKIFIMAKREEWRTNDPKWYRIMDYEGFLAKKRLKLRCDSLAN
jgi:hypothetical protein